MITIKDVAKRSGVSIGTVSNVLNGKTKNIELIQKVEFAIKELDYIPDSKAQNLKTSKTNLIGLILNNNYDAQSISLIREITNYLNDRGFDIVTLTTNGNVILEEIAILHFAKLGVDGLIVNTTARKKEWTKTYADKLPIVFLSNTPAIYNKINTIRFDYKKSSADFYNWCKNNNSKNIALLIDSSQEDFALAFDESFNMKILKVIDQTNELGFKLTYELLCESKEIDVILLGNNSMTKGVKKAIDLIGNKKIDLVCIKSENWIEDTDNFAGIINISINKLADNATKCIVDKINFNKTSLNLVTEVETNFVDLSAVKKIQLTEKVNETIRIAVLDVDIYKPLKYVCEIYEKNTNVNLIFEKMKYKELAEILSDKNKLENSNIDVIMYDLLWKNSIDENFLSSINITDQDYLNSFINSSISNYGKINSTIKGLPLISGTQLLIYRKDLFEDVSIKRKFELMFNYELKPPKTWEQYNDIAKFFTKKYNVDSKTDYGTALINQGNIYNSIEFFNRISNFGTYVAPEEILKDPNVTLITDDYLHSFEYTDKSKIFRDWNDIANSFKKGEIAMAILYDYLFYEINDPVYSKVAGNIGCSQIPGNKPVLGGWGVGVNNFSNNIDLSKEFIYWLCSIDTSNLFSILTGTSIHKEFYLNKELDIIYPWKKEVLEAYENSQIRNTNSNFSTPIDVVNYYNNVIGNTLGKLINNEKL